MFGAIVMLVILAATRVLEGASSAASVPSILGYIAMATAGDEVLRGKTSARFEAATLAGLGLGAIVGVKLFEFFENLGIGPAAFFLNAAFYGVSFLIYMFGVSDPPGEAEARAGEHVHVDRYLALIRSSHVLLLAPTWIAINAALGVWLSQSVFQLAKGDERFPNQVLMGGFTANQITIGAIIIAAIFGAGLIYWGNRFKTYRRTTIIGYGVIGGAALVVSRHRRQPLRHDAARAGDRGRDRGGRRPVRAGRRDTGRHRPAGRHVASGSRQTAARSWVSTPSSWRRARSPGR